MPTWLVETGALVDVEVTASLRSRPFCFDFLVPTLAAASEEVPSMELPLFRVTGLESSESPAPPTSTGAEALLEPAAESADIVT